MDEESIFRHRDRDGDELDVWALENALLFHNTSRTGELVTARLERGDILRLANALDTWLHNEREEAPSHAEDPEPIYTALVRRLVAEEVARVLPLHQSPQAASDGLATEIMNMCQIVGCDLIPSRTWHLEHDPEPQDVGHPAEPVIRTDVYSTGGANPSTVTQFIRADGTVVTDWSDALFGQPAYEPEHGRLMADLPRRRPLASLYCDGCKHLWSHHTNSGGCGAIVTEPDVECMCRSRG